MNAAGLSRENLELEGVFMEKDTTIGMGRLAALFDSGTFVETGAYLKRDGGEPTGVVCGYGAVDGRLVYAFAQDSDRRKGAFDALQAKKIQALYELALKNRAPVVGLFDSSGASVCDGASVLSAFGTLLGQISRASGGIPQIAVITGVCAGLAATAAAMFDLTVTIKGQSQLWVNAPFLIGQDVGTAEYTAGTGLSSMTAKSEAEALARVRELVGLLPANCEEGAYIGEICDDVNRAVAVDGLAGRELIRAVVDAGRFLEVGEGCAEEMLAGFARIGGVCCGLVANNPAVRGGALTGEGAKKAAKLIGFCDSYGIPVVTLTDSEGVAVSRAEESSPLAAQLGKLAMAYASAETAKITVVTGKAYGAAFTLMGSHALGADLVYALPGASVSVMAPEAAVAFLWNDRITPDRTRAELVEEWRQTRASAVSAAADGSIDDVIDPAELRSRICSAVYMLLAKQSGAPLRRHCNLPL